MTRQKIAGRFKVRKTPSFQKFSWHHAVPGFAIFILLLIVGKQDILLYCGSDVDYWNTLRCYLDTERNIAHTAKMLGIHRNTMIQRIERLNGILDLDLDDPMIRFWLRVSIWLLDEENKR